MKKFIKYKSQDNITDISAVIWTPATQVKAIIQISHGMNEYIEKYEPFALEMLKQGILVCGNDDLGHGYSVIDKAHYGYFAKKNAANILVDDLHTLTTIMKKDYPNVPYFLLGHSMGSFIARNYLSKYGNELDGALILGTALHNIPELNAAMALTKLESFYHHGWFYQSKKLYKLSTGNFYKYYPDETDKSCWLTKDKEFIAQYRKDPRSNFRFTCNAYYTMFQLIKRALLKRNIKKIPKDLPIILMAGKDDPVGNFGKDIYKLEKLYRRYRLNVSIKIYNELRHEILNEIEKAVVYNDVIQFIIKTINEKKENSNK